jgi:hypothetical protein
MNSDMVQLRGEIYISLLERPLSKNGYGDDVRFIRARKTKRKTEFDSGPANCSKYQERK